VRYRRADGMTWDDAGDRVVILDARGSTLITLNPVGTILWHQLTEPREPDALVDHLAQAFPEVDRAQLHADVDEFFDSLVREGLVVAEHAST
jgi:hypothetical protein